MSGIKATYIITDDNAETISYSETDNAPIEFKDEKAAIKRGTSELEALGDDRQVWVWRLSHVLSKSASVNVEAVA